MSDAATLHQRLVLRGIRFRVDGSSLVVEPASRLESADIAGLRKYKAEIHRRLSESDRQRAEAARAEPAEDDGDTPNPHLLGRWSRWGDLITCPHCRAADLIETAGGLRCQACGRLAWRAESNSITRVDCDTEKLGLKAVDFPRGEPAPEVHRQRQAAEVEQFDRRQAERLQRVASRPPNDNQVPLFQEET